MESNGDVVFKSMRIKKGLILAEIIPSPLLLKNSCSSLSRQIGWKEGGSKMNELFLKYSSSRKIGLNTSNLSDLSREEITV